MARLMGLGQPFGSPGRIINIPAPRGSEYAGQQQMQAMQGLGQALGAYLGQQRLQGLEREDLRRIESMPQTQDIFNTMFGARGMQAPQAQVPQMVSPQGRQAQLGGQLEGMFGDPFGERAARAGYYRAGAAGRGTSSGNRISSLLRAAEISERQSKTAPSAGLAQKYREDAKGFIDRAMGLLLPADASETTKRQRKRASQIDRRIQDETPRIGVEPTAKDLEKYGRMGVKEYVSPSGKKYPLTTKPVTSSEFKALPPGKQLTIAELSPIFEKAQKNGIKRLDLYREAAKLRGLGLSREEMLTAMDRLAEGATAEQLIEFLKTQPQPWKAP